MKSYYFSVLLFVGTFLLYSCGSPEAEEQETTAERPAVSTDSVTTEATSLLKLQDLELYKVTKGDQQRSTPISGRVIPKNTTQLFAEVQGLILPEGILFKEGVAFKKGDLLVSLDKREYELSLEAQRSSFFNSLTAIMPDMKTDYPDNYDNWLTYINDYNFGSTLPPLPATLSKKEKYYVTTYQIYSQYYAIKAAEERLKKYSIYAPYSGIVIQSNIDIGSLVSPGQPLGTIINRYSYELEAGVNLATAEQLRIGTKITFTSNAIAGEYTGVVVRKNNIIDPQTQNIPVYFQLSGKNIRQGMYLEGTFQVGAYQDVVTLPSSAISRNGHVLLLQDDVIQSKTVEAIDFLTDEVVVRGLTEGDQVILNNFELPVVGQKVALN